MTKKKRLVGLKVAALGAVLGLTACSGEAPLGAEEIGELGQALEGQWRMWRQEGDNENGFTYGPAACRTPGGYAIIARDKDTKRMRIARYQYLVSADWTDLGTKRFGSKPTCTSLDEFSDLPDRSSQIAILGKSRYSKTYYMRIMETDSDPEYNYGGPLIVEPPTLVQDWKKISSDSYDSAPAATVAGGHLIVVGRRKDGIYAHVNQLDVSDTETPFDNGNWQSRVAAPKLPSPWVPKGDPAIANTFPAIAAVTIATRARNSNTGEEKIYYSLWDGGNWNFTWVPFPTGPSPVDSDPALEFSPPLGMATFYFRAEDNKIYHGSGLGSLGWNLAALNRPETVKSSPAAVSWLGEGKHIVVSKHSDGQVHSIGADPLVYDK